MIARASPLYPTRWTPVPLACSSYKSSRPRPKQATTRRAANRRVGFFRLGFACLLCCTEAAGGRSLTKERVILPKRGEEITVPISEERGEERIREQDVHGPSCRAGEAGLARHRRPPRPPANHRTDEAEEGGEDVRVPRRARHVGDAEEDGCAGAVGGEGGRRRRGRRGCRRCQEEEGGVEPVRLLLLRVLSDRLSLENERRKEAFLLVLARERSKAASFLVSGLDFKLGFGSQRASKELFWFSIRDCPGEV